MRLKIGITFIMFCVCSLSFGQDYKTNTKSIKEVDVKIEEGSYNQDNSVSADRLIIKTSEQEGSEKDYNSSSTYNDEEWADIKKQILNNKKRINDGKEIFASKVVDTVFVTIPSLGNESQLSGW
ncbi:hypothetical protein SAMN04487910_1823 [Aquimarina amphilecti]|uniref:Uncharacterized protein n=1 Tax=Aquimarina amphilecti TaxID=1038014 RepID=A0A1H7MQN8_AQUAM|nr:hypothetical protein [Aquimarina amphilecti]SEL13646.1 hypothetical protein SAMN04487910_1823 [Aquimarina amphilecti]